jgi:hypothetical protein
VRAAVIGIVAVGALLVAPTASAAPAVLTAVTQDNRVLSASWTLPAGATAWVLEASTDQDFGSYSPGLFADLGATDTTFTAIQSLPGGTYYVRITTTTTPDECVVADPSCTFENSNVLSVTVPSQAATLQPVTQAGGVVSATWTLAGGVVPLFAEISTSAARDGRGFLDAVLTFQLVTTQASFIAGGPLAPGLYYVHIATTPTPDLCVNDDPACVRELSNIREISIPQPTSLPAKQSALPSPPAPTPDKALALGAVTASSSQDVDKLSITLNAGESVKVKLSGWVNVPGASKIFRFKTVSKSLGAGKTKLSLKLASKAKERVKRALRRKKRLKAKLTLVVTDNAGNTQTKKYTVRLKP